jgi:hypothetical protein
MLGRDIVPACVGAMLPALVRFCSPSVTMNSTTFCIDLLFERQWTGFCESHSISRLRSVIHVLVRGLGHVWPSFPDCLRFQETICSCELPMDFVSKN